MRTFSMPITDEIFLRPGDSEPGTMQMEADFTGHIDGDRLAAAVERAIWNHVETRLRLFRPRRNLRPPQWALERESIRSASNLVSVTTCDTEIGVTDSRDEFFSTPIDPRFVPLVRVKLVHHSRGDSLMLSAHHALTDGVGGLRLMRSIARAYTGKEDPVPLLDPADSRDLSKVARISERIPSQVVRRAGRHAMRTSTMLIPESSTNAPGYGFKNRLFDQALTRELLEHRSWPVSTLNDLLVAALHLTIDAWNRDHGEQTDFVSVLVPINARPQEMRGEAIANLTASGRVFSTVDERRDIARFVESVSQQCRLIKTNAIAAAGAPYWMNAIMLGLLIAMGPRARSSSILSNMGRIDEPLDFGPEPGSMIALWCAPPVTMPVGLSFGAATVNDRLHLSMRYRHALMSSDAAERFIDAYLDCFLRVVNVNHEAMKDIGTVRSA